MNEKEVMNCWPVEFCMKKSRNIVKYKFSADL